MSTPMPPAAESGDDQIDVHVNGVPVVVPADLKATIQRAIRMAGQPLPTEMTPSQAAEYLDVSRPFVIKLIKKGVLPCRMVGTHRRIPSPALVDYKKKMFVRAKEALDEMTRIAEEHRMYDD